MKMELIRARFTNLSGAWEDYSFKNNVTTGAVREIATLYPNLFQKTLDDVFGNADEREIIFSSNIRGSLLIQEDKIQEGDIYVSAQGSILKMVKNPKGVFFMIYIQPSSYSIGIGKVGIVELRRSNQIINIRWELLEPKHEYLLFMNWREDPFTLK